MDSTTKKEQTPKTTNKNHKVLINNQDSLTITGITRVYNANENLISLEISDINLVIEGANMQVTKLDVDAGNLEALGTFNLAKYTNSSQKSAKNFFSRVFK